MGSPANHAAELPNGLERLRPLHRPLGPVRSGDWLHHHKEPGQTFAQYVSSKPVTPTEERGVLYVQPLGEFTATQRRIIELTAEFMGVYYQIPVKIMDDVPLSVVPEHARRVHPQWGDKQILTGHVIHNILVPRLPKDAAACLALTTSDLWPGEGWNFVFGEASLRQRVGVWSLYRNGDPDAGEAAFRLCLLRTIKTATHETGHMFGMLHCIAYECNMCGSNHRAESDRRPLALCPECLAKLCWSTGADPGQRFKKLSAWCRKQGLKKESEFYDKCIKAVQGTAEPEPSD